MGIEVINADGIRARLRRTGNTTTKRALRRARKGALEIEQRAKQYAPVDSGDLENNIKLVEMREGTFHQRNEWDIGVDENGTQRRQHKENYHVEMHENYPAEFTRNTKKSKEKNDSLQGKLTGKVTLDRGKIVGGKYLERALNDYVDEITKDIEAIMRDTKL